MELQPDTMRDAETEVRVNTKADTLALVEAKKLCNTLRNLEPEA